MDDATNATPGPEYVIHPFSTDDCRELERLASTDMPIASWYRHCLVVEARTITLRARFGLSLRDCLILFEVHDVAAEVAMPGNDADDTREPWQS